MFAAFVEKLLKLRKNISSIFLAKNNNTMFFTFFRNGKPEEVEVQRWVWRAVYTDKTFLEQFDKQTKIFHQFEEIDQSRLKLFIIYKFEDPSKKFEILISDKMKPIFFYRNLVSVNPYSLSRIYAFGWEKLVNGKNQKVVNFIFPNDSLVMATNRMVDDINLLEFL